MFGHTVYLCTSHDPHHFEGLAVDGRIMLKWIFKKWDWVEARIGSIWLRIGTGGRLL
jgi:hypothetical protein